MFSFLVKTNIRNDLRYEDTQNELSSIYQSARRAWKSALRNFRSSYEILQYADLCVGREVVHCTYNVRRIYVYQRTFLVHLRTFT